MIHGEVLLKEMEYKVKIGVSREERAVPQKIIFDIACRLDVTKAVQTQNIEDTVNYSSIQKTIKFFLENKEYRLLEKIVNDITVLLLEKFPKIKKITVIGWKPDALAKKDVNNVGIRITKQIAKLPKTHKRR